MGYFIAEKVVTSGVEILNEKQKQAATCFGLRIHYSHVGGDIVDMEKEYAT